MEKNGYRGLQRLMLVMFMTIGISGCAAPSVMLDSMENISISAKFTHVEKEADRKRIDGIIASYALSPEMVKKKGRRSKITYDFRVKDLETLNRLHQEIIYDGKGEHIFNAYDPIFYVNYSTIDISASIDIIVRFRVTPYAKLFYKTFDDQEVDISQMVDSKGKVKLKTRISRGQEYIKAKIISDKVEKFILIDIVTQKVEPIDKSFYMKSYH